MVANKLIIRRLSPYRSNLKHLGGSASYTLIFIMKKKYDAVATVGKYTAKDGTEKKRYLTVGAIFESEDGRLSLKLDGMPVSPEWSGWISFYEPKQQQGGNAGGSTQDSEPDNIPW